jgi:hypothetical protein
MRINLTYEAEKTVFFDSGNMNDKEIEDMIESLRQDHSPNGYDDVCSSWECLDDSIPPIIPPDESWVEFYGGGWATDGHCILRRQCPTLAFPGGRDWLSQEKAKPAMARYLKYFKYNTKCDRPHTGLFSNRFLPLKNAGCKVYGDAPIDPGFCLLDGWLVAIIAPLARDNSDCFRF